MKHAVTLLVLLAVAVAAHPTQGIAMWGCAAEGERRSVLYLADRGARSYVKFGTQRVSARVTMADSQRTWTFGTTTVVLKVDGVADYSEGGTLKQSFRCKLMQ